jgi:hypothetical protein
VTGYLARYSGTEFVNVETGEHADTHDGMEWWVEIRTSLPQVDHDAAEQAMTGTAEAVGKMGSAEMDVRMSPNASAWQEELVARSIVNWNLTDETETPLLIGRLDANMPAAERAEAVAVTKASVVRLPHHAVLHLFIRIRQLNTTPEAAAALSVGRDGFASEIDRMTSHDLPVVAGVRS